MDFFETVDLRRSIRSFAATPVEEEKLLSILEASNRAPSAGNQQAYEIYRVSSVEAKSRLRIAARDREAITAAGTALVFCANPDRSGSRFGERGTNLYAVQDATIACSFAALAATALGLGTLWVGSFDEEPVRQAIGAPEGVRPLSILLIGYPAENPDPRPRRPLSELVHEVMAGQ